MNIATYIVRKSPNTHHLWHIRGPAHQISELAGCQNAQTRAAANIFNGKEEQYKRSKDHQYTESKKEVAGDFLCAAAMLI